MPRCRMTSCVPSILSVGSLLFAGACRAGYPANETLELRFVEHDGQAVLILRSDKDRMRPPVGKRTLSAQVSSRSPARHAAGKPAVILSASCVGGAVQARPPGGDALAFFAHPQARRARHGVL